MKSETITILDKRPSRFGARVAPGDFDRLIESLGLQPGDKKSFRAQLHPLQEGDWISSLPSHFVPLALRVREDAAELPGAEPILKKLVQQACAVAVRRDARRSLAVQADLAARLYRHGLEQLRGQLRGKAVAS